LNLSLILLGGTVELGLVGGIVVGFSFPTIRMLHIFSRGDEMMQKFLIGSIVGSNIIWESVPLACFNASSVA
jgi:hypothetical protein